jgi:hypothetical protein
MLIPEFEPEKLKNKVNLFNPIIIIIIIILGFMAYNFLTLDEKQGCCVIKKKKEKKSHLKKK